MKNNKMDKSDFIRHLQKTLGPKFTINLNAIELDSIICALDNVIKLCLSEFVKSTLTTKDLVEYAELKGKLYEIRWGEGHKKTIFDNMPDEGLDKGGYLVPQDLEKK